MAYERRADADAGAERSDGGVSRAGNPWLIAILVALAAFMEVLDTTIANVALPYIAGGMGVSEDEASWVVTTYLVANAVILTASSFLAQMLGRKTFFLALPRAVHRELGAVRLCLEPQSLLLFRVMQGLGGGGMVPVAQSILADSLPAGEARPGLRAVRRRRGRRAVVGPTLGGWLADNLSWHWCFLINGPVGVLAIALISMILRESAGSDRGTPATKQSGVRFDLVGFVLVATFLGALEIVLDRGQDGRLVRLAASSSRSR